MLTIYDVLRLGGGMAVAGGLTLGLGHLVTAVSKVRHNQPLAALGEIFILFGNTALIFGVTALYAYQLELVGILGLVGYLLAAIGSMGLSPGTGLFEELVPEARQLLVKASTQGFGMFLAVAPAVSFVVGYIVFGVATIMAGRLPGGVGIFLIVGAIALFAGAGLLRNEPKLGPWVRGGGGIGIGIGLAWAGLSLILTV